VVHRDIKPQNILFSSDGKVKVTDFGIAIAGDGVTVTVGDEIIGTVQYISPEQAKGELADKQSDLYSLGIVLYEMVTGKVPFGGESPVAVAMKHIQDQIVPPRAIVEDLPLALEQIITKAVEKDKAIGMRAPQKSWKI
jgi:eukaryotic-like serine/threonine-protein kinase